VIENLFSCIGAQKAGTTWLHSVLKNDERLAFPKHVKETHYFSWCDYGSRLVHRWRAAQLKNMAEQPNFTQALSSYLSANKPKAKSPTRLMEHKIATCIGAVDDAWYEALFKKTENFCVDVTPEYALMGPAGFQHMAALANRLELLFLLRDPAERSWSGLLQKYKSKLDFEALQLKLTTMSTRELMNELADPAVAKRTDYTATFEAVAKAGLKNKLHVGYYDDIKKNPQSVLDTTYKAMGMTPRLFPAEELSKVVHRSPDVGMPPIIDEMLIQRYRPMVAEISKNFADIPADWRSRYGI
jgi:hypothetical protein